MLTAQGCVVVSIFDIVLNALGLSDTCLAFADTVEDRILALQEKKRKLAEAALGDGDTGMQASRLTVEDLHFLFSAD